MFKRAWLILKCNVSSSLGYKIELWIGMMFSLRKKSFISCCRQVDSEYIFVQQYFPLPFFYCVICLKSPKQKCAAETSIVRRACHVWLDAATKQFINWNCWVINWPILKSHTCKCFQCICLGDLVHSPQVLVNQCPTWVLSLARFRSSERIDFYRNW